MNYQLTTKDSALISTIMDNCKIPARHRLNMELSMRVCHANGCALDLDRMVKVGLTSDVVHDVYGIDKHTCRETGKLLNCFIPRFAKEQ